jgi:predicted site-specific integrase-resolvase
MLWLNSKEYCSKYKISNTTLKRWVDDGNVKCKKSLENSKNEF